MEKSELSRTLCEANEEEMLESENDDPPIFTHQGRLSVFNAWKEPAGATSLPDPAEAKKYKSTLHESLAHLKDCMKEISKEEGIILEDELDDLQDELEEEEEDGVDSSDSFCDYLPRLSEAFSFTKEPTEDEKYSLDGDCTGVDTCKLCAKIIRESRLKAKGLDVPLTCMTRNVVYRITSYDGYIPSDYINLTTSPLRRELRELREIIASGRGVERRFVDYYQVHDFMKARIVVIGKSDDFHTLIKTTVTAKKESYGFLRVSLNVPIPSDRVITNRDLGSPPPRPRPPKSTGENGMQCTGSNKETGDGDDGDDCKPHVLLDEEDSESHASQPLVRFISKMPYWPLRPKPRLPQPMSAADFDALYPSPLLTPTRKKRQLSYAPQTNSFKSRLKRNNTCPWNINAPPPSSESSLSSSPTKEAATPQLGRRRFTISGPRPSQSHAPGDGQSFRTRRMASIMMSSEEAKRRGINLPSEPRPSEKGNVATSGQQVSHEKKPTKGPKFVDRIRNRSMSLMSGGSNQTNPRLAKNASVPYFKFSETEEDDCNDAAPVLGRKKPAKEIDEFVPQETGKSERSPSLLQRRNTAKDTIICPPLPLKSKFIPNEVNKPSAKETGDKLPPLTRNKEELKTKKDPDFGKQASGLATKENDFSMPPIDDTKTSLVEQGGRGRERRAVVGRGPRPPPRPPARPPLSARSARPPWNSPATNKHSSSNDPPQLPLLSKKTSNIRGGKPVTAGEGSRLAASRNETKLNLTDVNVSAKPPAGEKSKERAQTALRGRGLAAGNKTKETYSKAEREADPITQPDELPPLSSSDGSELQLHDPKRNRKEIRDILTARHPHKTQKKSTRPPFK